MFSTTRLLNRPGALSSRSVGAVRQLRKGQFAVNICRLRSLHELVRIIITESVKRIPANGSPSAFTFVSELATVVKDYMRW